jgi:hypothetical protein
LQFESARYDMYQTASTDKHLKRFCYAGELLFIRVFAVHFP